MLSLIFFQVGPKLKKMYGKYDSLVVHKIEERLTFDMSALPDTRRPTICYLRNMCDDPWHNQKQKYLQNLLLDSYRFETLEFCAVFSYYIDQIA